jgi:hypothetical protein
MTTQQQLPGTERVAGTFECGHERSHQVPSESVRLLKMGGAGFVVVCDCGPEPLSDANDRPHRLGGHVTLVGGASLGPGFWLVLENLADGWWTADSGETTPVDGGRTAAERRADRKRAYREGWSA